MTYRAASDAHYAAAAPELQARWGKIDLHAWLAPIARHLHGLPRAAHILDIGAGTGQLSAHLALRGHRVTAVEPVAELWQEHAVSRIQDDLPRLGLINGPFDLVLGLSVLHHLPPADQRRALGRMADLTAPGGALILAA
ncbi:MAG: class I SAM-dependent methyltransferase, partial [Pseudomonadota bacterium]